MGKIEDRMQLALDAANKLHPSAHGVEIQTKRKQRNAAPAAEHLSEVNESHLVIPPTYRNQYERLKQRDPAKAQEFWNKWAYDPRSKPLDKHKLARIMLERVGKDNTLRRRV